MFLFYRLAHGGSGTYRGHPLMNQGLLIHFFDFLIAEVFLHKISISEKSYEKLCPKGGARVRPSDLKIHFVLL